MDNIIDTYRGWVDDTIEQQKIFWTKEHIKLALIFLILGWVLYARTYGGYPSGGCMYYPDPDGPPVYGDCQWIHDQQTQFNIPDDTFMLIHNPTTTTQPTQIRTQTTQTTTTTCPTCVCPTTTTAAAKPCDCPPDIAEYYLYPETTIHEALEWRIGEGSTAYQSGAADAKNYYLELFQVPGRPKFKSRPSVTDMAAWSGVALVKKPDTQYCFLADEDYSFLLNRTPDMLGRPRWGWNDDECKGSTLRVRKL